MKSSNGIIGYLKSKAKEIKEDAEAGEKICPLLANRYGSHKPSSGILKKLALPSDRCQGKDCAWFVNGECAIVRIAKSFGFTNEERKGN